MLALSGFVMRLRTCLLFTFSSSTWNAAQWIIKDFRELSERSTARTEEDQKILNS